MFLFRSMELKDYLLRRVKLKETKLFALRSQLMWPRKLPS